MWSKIGGRWWKRPNVAATKIKIHQFQSQACSNKFGVQKHTLVSRNRERNELSDVYKQCVLMNRIPHLISSTQSARTPERVSKPAQIAPTYGQGCGIGPDYKYCKNLPFPSAADDLQLRRTPQIVRYWLFLPVGQFWVVWNHLRVICARRYRVFFHWASP